MMNRYLGGYEINDIQAQVRKVIKGVGNPEPPLDLLQEWESNDGGCEATDGCWVEPDGVCPHGYPSWLLQLGYI